MVYYFHEHFFTWERHVYLELPYKLYENNQDLLKKILFANNFVQ